MGIVAYYARIGAPEVGALDLDPEQYWELAEMPWDLSKAPEAAASERLYVDKDWQVLSWLCSELGRAEKRHQAALIQIKDMPSSRDEIRAALEREAEAMGFRYLDPKELSLDPVLGAIQGRGDVAGPTIPNLGISATAFSPSEVQGFASALNSLGDAWLRERFDVREMEALGLGGDCVETELEEFYLPQLARITALYNRAATAGQHVVVVMS